MRSSSIMAAGTVMSRLTGFARTVALVAAVGTGVFADTFNVANTTPNVLYILLVGGVLNAVFVPVLVRARKEDADGGEAYTQRLLTLTALLLLGLTVAAVVAAPLIVRLYISDFDPAALEQATTFARYVLPQIFFYGLFTIFGQVLNSRGRFGAMMWTPILNNLVVIVVCLLFLAAVSGPPEVGRVSAGEAALLGLGTTLGVIAQTVALLPALRASGFRLRPRFGFRGAGLGTAGRLARWTVLFVLVNQLGYLVIVNLATAAGASAARAGADHGAGYTPYNAAYLLFLLPHAVVTVSIVTALLPRMSEHAADQRLDLVREDVSTGLRLTAVALIPGSLGFAVLGPDLATVAFSLGGAASTADARFIGIVLAVFALGLVPFSGHHLVLRGFYAQQDTRTPVFLNVVLVSVNVVIALALSRVLPADVLVVGLAAGYALSYWVGFLLSGRVLGRRLGGLEGARVLRTYVRLLVAGVAGALAALLVVTLVHRSADSGPAGSAMAVVGGGAAGAAVYLATAAGLRVTELTGLLTAVRGRLGR
jgi:putative peptidoglycan lipid II flippase